MKDNTNLRYGVVSDIDSTLTICVCALIRMEDRKHRSGVVDNNKVIKYLVLQKSQRDKCVHGKIKISSPKK